MFAIPDNTVIQLQSKSNPSTTTGYGIAETTAGVQAQVWWLLTTQSSSLPPDVPHVLEIAGGVWANIKKIADFAAQVSPQFKQGLNLWVKCNAVEKTGYAQLPGAADWPKPPAPTPAPPAPVLTFFRRPPFSHDILAHSLQVGHSGGGGGAAYDALKKQLAEQEEWAKQFNTLVSNQMDWKTARITSNQSTIGHVITESTDPGKTTTEHWFLYSGYKIDAQTIPYLDQMKTGRQLGDVIDVQWGSGQSLVVTTCNYYGKVQ